MLATACPKPKKRKPKPPKWLSRSKPLNRATKPGSKSPPRRYRLASRKRRIKSRAEKAHLDRVAALGCIVCRSPASIHHIRHGQGMGMRSSDYGAIPLCHNHHQGREGIHTLGTKAWQKIYGEEADLLDQVYRELAVEKPRISCHKRGSGGSVEDRPASNLKRE